ncbi:hypothetical protein ACOSQ2_018861 [Xanthoceras sorbifolium]
MKSVAVVFVLFSILCVVAHITIDAAIDRSPFIINTKHLNSDQTVKGLAAIATSARIHQSASYAVETKFVSYFFLLNKTLVLRLNLFSDFFLLNKTISCNYLEFYLVI